MVKDDLTYLEHIKDSIDYIESYIEGSTLDLFLKNELLQDAVIRRIMIIGEATNNLTKEFQYAHPDIPFADIIGMRNFVVHDYSAVDLKQVWDTIIDDLPPLKEAIEKAINE